MDTSMHDTAYCFIMFQHCICLQRYCLNLTYSKCSTESDWGVQTSTSTKHLFHMRCKERCLPRRRRFNCIRTATKDFAIISLKFCCCTLQQQCSIYELFHELMNTLKILFNVSEMFVNLNDFFRLLWQLCVRTLWRRQVLHSGRLWIH